MPNVAGHLRQMVPANYKTATVFVKLLNFKAPRILASGALAWLAFDSGAK
ncbi:hypothetical protein D1AOALGA4SA_8373 [Olavius algarvensis Delta 1 endosymbiont]|nr:hypothetical protein D1AOALGA4SA_8373 [Olavius algarvensis Delta 1 endosymbiont]